MYKTILMPLDGTPTDRAIIEHIKQLAQLLHSRVVVFHVATSVAAQWHGSEAGGGCFRGCISRRFSTPFGRARPVSMVGSSPWV